MLDNLLLFIRLAEVQSYTALSVEFACTKSTISRSIKKLEKHFGKKLIERSSRKFCLTIDGEFIYSKFKALPKQLDETHSQLNRVVKKASGVLRVVLPTILSQILITPYLHYFSEKNPDVTLEIMFSHERPNMSLFDIALTSFSNLIDSEKFDFRFMRSEQIKLYCTKGDAEKFGVPKDIAEIAQHNIISALDPFTLAAINTELLIHEHTKETQTLDVSHAKVRMFPATHVLQIGLQNNYIFWSFDSLCHDLLVSGELISVLPEYYYQRFEFFVITKKRISHEEQVFIDFLYRCMNGQIKNDIANGK